MECEQCAYYIYDEAYGEEQCTLLLDEDEYVSFLSESRKHCRYFRPYDEYKMVEKQN